MKKVLLLIVSLIALSCSKDKAPDYITLDKSELIIKYGDEKSVLFDTNVDYVAANVEDDYFASVFANLTTIDVTARKVGETKAVITAGEATAELLIRVEPKEDYIGTPIVALGQDMAYIKANEDAALTGIDTDCLTYKDDYVPHWAIHRYYFKNNRLDYIKTTIPISKLNSDFNTYIIQISKSLKERYTYDGSFMGEHRLIYSYKYENEYYIGIVQGTGNGDWYLCYAKSMDKIKEVLDKHPSIAI